MKNYWQNAVTFDEYIKETERRIEVQNPEDDDNEYYELGTSEDEQNFENL